RRGFLPGGPSRFVRPLAQRVALPLPLPLEPQRAKAVIARELHAVVRQPALGPRLARGGCAGAVRVEQLELAAVARVAQRGATPQPAQPHRGFTTQGAEARVVELARGSVEVGRVAPDRGRAPTEPAARSLHPQ